ncbi:DsbA family protein [Actinosynnema sp. NPDC020468]|uniref:2-hydroxychromene-2-carboxylate isomerase n=1 Tax=Actinosynnema sp. NPDC020468 TaxID=3154488 RepID=UPI0033E3E714
MRKSLPRLYFSFRSPFSWMAVEALRRALPDALARFDLVPFWDPDPATSAALTARGADTHYTQMSKAKHLYILQDTRRCAEKLGLAMKWPVDVDPWWEVPHLAWLAARREGRAEAFYDAVVAARWGRGEDVCDQDAVALLAERAGVDPSAALAPADPELRAEGVTCLERAWHDDVFGIPYLFLGRHRFWGLDRIPDFLAAYHRSDTVPPAVPVGVVAGDRDTAGGCG